MMEAGHAAVDRCKCRNLGYNHQHCSNDLVAGYRTETEEDDKERNTVEADNSAKSVLLLGLRIMHIFPVRNSGRQR